MIMIDPPYLRSAYHSITLPPPKSVPMETLATLTKAITEGNMGMLSYFFEQCQVNVETTDLLGSTPLMIAALEGQMEVVKYLLSLKADVNAQNIWGETPLMHAARRNHCDILLLLIENKADVNSTASNGESALAIAALRGHFKAMSLLSTKGAHPVMFIVSPLMYMALQREVARAIIEENDPSVSTVRPTNNRPNW